MSTQVEVSGGLDVRQTSWFRTWPRLIMNPAPPPIDKIPHGYVGALIL